MKKYVDFFAEATNGMQPHVWQGENGLAEDATCSNRLIRIPTGFGKTLGVLSAWLWHAARQQRGDWPRRLVLTLPMRVLVEQTEDEVRKVLARLNLLWDETTDHAGKIGVHVLMGGADSGEWYLYPEHFAVLICTQDMGLSAALNRAYGAPRARWPAQFGLLNQDTLWVMDEVQLMDVGLATSAQLQAFRHDDQTSNRVFRPCFTWWMSATLQPRWLQNSPDTGTITADLPQTRIARDQRTGALWDDVSKPCRTQAITDIPALAALVATQHIENGKGSRGPTLTIVNRVNSAVNVFEALKNNTELEGTDIRLVHSRFRPNERKAWRGEFLNRTECASGTDRIIIATQVVEAGVDISAALLITELAPWASLVQRFGRCARWGGTAQVVVADFGYEDDNKDARKAAPYAVESLIASRGALRLLSDVAPLHLEAFEETHRDLLPGLYPYQPKHLLLRHELDELFDTTSDLSGADIDISRFIRSGEERDVHVFWSAVAASEQPSRNRKPLRDELCAVPFLKARDWLFDSSANAGKTIWKGFRNKKRAWVWDWQNGQWKRAEASDLYPGRTVLVDAASGGYDLQTGWSPDNTRPVRPLDTEQSHDYVEVACWNKDAHGNACPGSRRRRRYATDTFAQADADADAAEDDESMSQAAHYQTIAFHGRQTGQLAAGLAQILSPALAPLFDLAGRWHDAGKAHAAFQGSIRASSRPARNDLAKAPDAAWPCSPRDYYRVSDHESRRGFRHELASTLMLFAVLQRHAPDHPALLGPWRDLLRQAGMDSLAVESTNAPPNTLEQEIIQLGADDFNLLAYLVCTHHGKVRMSWHASPADQAANATALRIRGVIDGDPVPALSLADAADGFSSLPASRLDLAPASAGLNPVTGMGWTERVLGLLDQHGPFALAWLEALLIAADRRASRLPLVDPLLTRDNAAHGLETEHRTLAQSAGSGETPHPLAADTAQRGGEHGLRVRTGESVDAGSRTRAPTDATRHVETRLGTLSYAELAPHLARRVQVLEQAIEAGQFDNRALDDTLINELQQTICGDLTPQLMGWRHHDVSVGTHTPPDHFQIPVLMREYVRDLVARLDICATTLDQRLLETLAFAEGRLLSIHPFADFNGRTTRVWLRLLLRRLDLPWVDLLPERGAEQGYLSALRAADRNDWQPLIDLWRQRFAAEGTP